MTAMLRIVATIALALVGSWQARADDRSTCYLLNSGDRTNSERQDAAILACSRLISSTNGAWQAFAYFDTAIRIDPHHIEGCAVLQNGAACRWYALSRISITPRGCLE